MYSPREKTETNTISTNDKEDLSKKNKVDINILLNRVRADKKKQQIESGFFIGIIFLAVIISGVILSFR